MKFNHSVFSWQQYKYRFVPWLAYNWKRNKKTVRRIKKCEDLDHSAELNLIEILENLFEDFQSAENENVPTNSILKQDFGFQVERKTSSIENAGQGVFVTSGCIPKNHIAAMYPGTIYYPSDPLLFQSIGNPFILRCIDGIMIDGNNRGISKYIYRSCCGRDMIGPYKPCDTSWLNNCKKNPLTIGQFVNNQTSQKPANVIYQELDIPSSFPLHLRSYLPNVYYQNQMLQDSSEYEAVDKVIRVVVLMSLRCIEQGEELLSAYYTEVH